MAEAIFRNLASQHFDCSAEKLWDHNVDVLSAGLAAGDSQPASANAVKVLKERGIDLSQHLSQQLDETMLEASDIVLTMTGDHKYMIDRARPDLSGKVRLLCRDNRNVIDPIGGSLEDYAQCADMISECLHDVLNDFLKKDAQT